MFKVLILLAVFAVLGAQAHHWHFKVEFGRDNVEMTPIEDSELGSDLGIENFSIEGKIARAAIRGAFHLFTRHHHHEDSKN